jgi:hypothetical protein
LEKRSNRRWSHSLNPLSNRIETREEEDWERSLRDGSDPIANLPEDEVMRREVRRRGRGGGRDVKERESRQTDRREREGGQSEEGRSREREGGV